MQDKNKQPLSLGGLVCRHYAAVELTGAVGGFWNRHRRQQPVDTGVACPTQLLIITELQDHRMREALMLIQCSDAPVQDYREQDTSFMYKM